MYPFLLAHEVSVIVTLNGAVPAEPVSVSLTADQAAFAGSSGTSPSATATVETDGNGQAVIELNPPSEDAFDTTVLEASGSLDGLPFSCRGSVLVGLGTSTRSLETLYGSTDGAKALLDRFRENVLAGIDPDAERELVDEVVRIVLANPMLLLRVQQRFKQYQPRIQAILGGKSETVHDALLEEVDELLNVLKSHASPALRIIIGKSQGLLRDPYLLVGVPGITLRPSARRHRDQGDPQHRPGTEDAARAATEYARLPVSFEANLGQGTIG